jgi:hypothetical protein
VPRDHGFDRKSDRTHPVTGRVVPYVIAMNVYAPHVHVQFP